MKTTLFDKLLLISDLLQRDMARSFADTPLSSSRVAVLWVVQHLGPSTQQAVADALGVSARNVSALVDALEHHDYLRRSAHPTDRRAVIVELTAASEKLMKSMQREHEEVTATLIASVATKDRPALERGLDAITARLTQIVSEAESPGASR